MGADKVVNMTEEEELKRKQKRTKDSNYVEIRIETENDGVGQFQNLPDGRTVLKQGSKNTVRTSEVGIKSDE